MERVYTHAKWQIKAGERNKVLELLTHVALKTRTEQGNLFYQVFQSNSDENTLLLYECYVNAAAVEVHRNTAYFKDIVIGQIIPLLTTREVVLLSEIEL